jgi:hypothetical protein
MEGVIDSERAASDWRAGAIAPCGYDGASASPEDPNKGNQCPAGPIADAARWTYRHGDATKSAGDWVELDASGVVALGTAGRNPQVMLWGATGVAIGKDVSLIGSIMKTGSAIVLFKMGDPMPAIRDALDRADAPVGPVNSATVADALGPKAAQLLNNAPQCGND